MKIQWYPGHMTKARRAMENDVKLVDLVMELVDARVPLGSRNPDIDRLAGGKARLVLLNKADLADPSINRQWKSYFEKQGIPAVELNARSGSGMKAVQDAMAGTMYAGNEFSIATGIVANEGIFYYLYKGVEWVIFPPLIFMGIGAMTDFGPMIANPSSMLMGAAAQLGIFITFTVAILIGFTGEEAASIGIIGGADGPTAIYVTTKLAPHLLASIAVAAYSYMALIKIIQPPIITLLTTKKERGIVMEQLRPVSKTEKVIFPLVVTGIVGVLLPSAIPLIGMLMLGNLFRESGVVPRLTKTASNELINIVTILLGTLVGSKATADTFLTQQTLLIMVIGVVAFSLGTAGGVLIGKLMCLLTKGKVNPIIGAAGVSAVPMAARIAHNVGQEENPNNYLLMHAMGPNVSGVIGSAVAAGVLLACFGVF